MEDLLAAFDRGEQRALARAITRCESGQGEPLIRALFDRAGRAMTIGLTGPPGVGKSTLTAALVAHVRRLELPLAGRRTEIIEEHLAVQVLELGVAFHQCTPACGRILKKSSVRVSARPSASTSLSSLYK